MLGSSSLGSAPLGSTPSSGAATPAFYITPTTGHATGAIAITAIYSGGAVTAVSNPFTISSGGASSITGYVQVNASTATFNLNVTAVSSTLIVIADSVTSTTQSYNPAAVVPGAPTGVSATAGNAQATVTGTAPVDNGGSAILNYTATGSPSGSATGSLPLTVTGLTIGVAHTFTLHANNAVGAGPESSPSGAVTPTGGTAATATTLSGPSTGVVGVASTNFTAGANGVITGTMIVTPSSSGGGGTFTPTTVSISAGSPTATFTYTPSSAGAKTISITNSGGLTNPASLTYTATAVGATSTTLIGPSSGTVLVASTAFAVGLNGAITATVVVTPNDAGNGGTFAPTTISISAGTPTGTFTYTPATVGTKTISITNSGGLSNAPSLTYASNSAGSLTTYPAYPQSVASKERPLRGRKVLRATNGAVKARTFYTSPVKAWDIVHQYLTTAEKAAWEAFYTANASSSFSFYWAGDGVTYTVIFGESDVVWQPIAGGWWGVTVELLQK